LHIETRTVSAVSAESFNDVFSADYNSYKITIIGDYSTSATMSLRYRVSGSDNSSANYNTQRTLFVGTTLSAFRSNSGTSHLIANNSETILKHSLEISNPFNTTKTYFTNLKVGGDVNIEYTGGFKDDTTSYTGFSLLASTGNFSGTVSIYGYAKA
jgi:hypothetical protein